MSLWTVKAVFFTTDATTVVAPTAFEAVSEYLIDGNFAFVVVVHQEWQRARGIRVFPWPCKHARVRTLRTKLGVSRQRLANSLRSLHSPGITEYGLRWFSSQQRNHSVNAHLRASTERVQAVDQSTEMRSVLDFFATAQSLFPFFVLATETRESRESHGETRSTEHALNDVVGKVPVRSCRECHRKT